MHLSPRPCLPARSSPVPALGGALLALLLLGGACRKDEGPERLGRARARYGALLEQRARPQDPGFDAVLAELQAIPPSSRAHPEAQRLAEAIRTARKPGVGRPLARAPRSGGELPVEAGEEEALAAVGALEAACARLAQQLGEAPAEERSRLEGALGRCREQLERVKASAHAH